MNSYATDKQMASPSDYSPEKQLSRLAYDAGLDLTDFNFAQEMDSRDPLRRFRDEFVIPGLDDTNGKTPVYLCGHSLGLKPKRCDRYVKRVLDDWAQRGVESHFKGFLPAFYCETLVQEDMAQLVGAKTSEVAILNGLTVNLHIMLTAFYKPTESRHKIIIEGDAFGSDMYAVKSQIELRGYSVTTSLVTLTPRKGESCLRKEDILEVITREGPQTALVLLPGVQYLTGQKLDLPAIIRAGHKQGCVVGIDLAHSVGNVPVRLHEWGPDFAVWCTYKYLNCGAGSLGAIWVNERHCSSAQQGPSYMQGWFGNKSETRLNTEPDFEPDEGAARFKLSNTSPVLVAMMKASLELFLEAGLDRLYEKQYLLTGYLEYLLKVHLSNRGMTITTPASPDQRGCQLSLRFPTDQKDLSKRLLERQIYVDVRKQRVIRVAPAPLYNSFQDVWHFVKTLKEIVQ